MAGLKTPANVGVFVRTGPAKDARRRGHHGNQTRPSATLKTPAEKENSENKKDSEKIRRSSDKAKPYEIDVETSVLRNKSNPMDFYTHQGYVSTSPTRCILSGKGDKTLDFRILSDPGVLGLYEENKYQKRN